VSDADRGIADDDLDDDLDDDDLVDDDDLDDLDDEDDDPDDDDLGADDDALDDDEDDEDDDGPDPNRIAAPTATTVLEYVVRAIVEEGDRVDIEVDEGRRGVSLRVHVDPSDMGRVIGKRGRTANAIRAVVRAAAVRDGVDVDVDFVD
jgi:uncharacterized protein